MQHIKFFESTRIMNIKCLLWRTLSSPLYVSKGTKHLKVPKDHLLTSKHEKVFSGGVCTSLYEILEMLLPDGRKKNILKRVFASWYKANMAKEANNMLRCFNLSILFSIDEPLNRKLFALQEQNTQEIHLFGPASPASGPRVEAMDNVRHEQQLEGVTFTRGHH